MERSFIHVILPLRLFWIPTYACTEKVELGQAVSVEFSNRRYIGIVWDTDASPDLPPERIQDIICVEHSIPTIDQREMRLWKFIHEYYMCTPGEVYKAAYPAMKIRGEQAVAARTERLGRELGSIEQKLLGRHCDRVRQRLELRRDELSKAISEARNPRNISSVAADGPAGRPLVLVGTRRHEQYLEKVRKALSSGSQVLILCPESAFIKRLEQFLRPQLPDSLYIFNAERTAAAKKKVSDALRQGIPMAVLGARSSVFLPFRRLSLVIIDEEQDASYKQTEPAPRYNGRDTAICLAGIHSAEVVLGAAVPSLETLYNCRTGKYRMQTLPGQASAVSVIDIVVERRKRGMAGAFSRKMIDAVTASDRPLVILRGWEKAEEVKAAAEALFPQRELKVLTLYQLRHEGVPQSALIAVLQADALVSKDDFRSDERAMQITAMLQGLASEVIIQTAVPSRFDGSRGAEALLAERGEFGFPLTPVWWNCAARAAARFSKGISSTRARSSRHRNGKSPRTPLHTPMWT